MKKTIILIFMILLVGCTTTNSIENITKTLTKTTVTLVPFDSSYSGKYILKNFYKDDELINPGYEYNYIEIDESGYFKIKNKINDKVTNLEGFCQIIDENKIEFIFKIDEIEIRNIYQISENKTLIFEDKAGNSLVKLVYEKE